MTLERKAKLKMSLRVVARIQAKPDHVDRVRECLLELIEPTRREAGCIVYELLQNRDDPTDFTFIEEWASDAALDAHAVSEHLRDVREKLTGLTVTKPDIRKYDLVA